MLSANLLSRRTVMLYAVLRLRFSLQILCPFLSIFGIADYSNDVPLSLLLHHFSSHFGSVKLNIISNKRHRIFPVPFAICKLALSAYRLLYAVLNDIYNFENELALHCAIEDEIMLPALMHDQALAQNNSHKQKGQEIEELSQREKDILIQIVKGLSNKEIADALFLSTHTVMSHRKNIVRKLNIHSTAGLTIYAIVNGIVNIDKIDII